MLHRRAIGLAHVESPDKARAHRGLAESYHALGQHDQAHDHWRRAQTVLSGLGLTDDGEIGIEHIRARLG